MELTLKRLLEQAEFKKYRGKGYDPTEVDDFLDRAVAMASKVEVQLTQALDQAKRGGGDAPAGPSAAEIEAEVDRRVAERLAQEPGGPSEEEMAEEVRRTLIMAQRTADAAVKEAREEAEALRTSSREESEAMLASAREASEAMVSEAERRAAELNAESDQRAAAARSELEAETTRERREARQRLAGEIAELEGLRESLRSDVNVLERHVEEQRTQLGSTLAELQQILDDPSGFRMAPPPALIDPELPDFSDLDEPEPASPAPSEPDVEPEPEASAAERSAADESAPVLLDAEPPSEPERASGGPDSPAEAEAPTAPPALAFDEVDHEAPGLDDPLDPGPPTAPVAAVDLGFGAPAAPPSKPDADDDAFLAELRKAMADDEPLGPRDQEPSHVGDALFEDDDRRGWRFGRRR